MINQALSVVGIEGPAWLTDPKLALLSVAFVDIWKGVGLAALIYIAGIVSIPHDYYEAAKVDGSGALGTFWHIVLPLMRPATVTVIILSLIGGLRSFDQEVFAAQDYLLIIAFINSVILTVSSVAIMVVLATMVAFGHRHCHRGSVGACLQRLRQPAVLPAR